MRSDMLMCSECGAPVTWEEAAKDRADTIRLLSSLLRDALPYVEDTAGDCGLAADIRQALGETE